MIKAILTDIEGTTSSLSFVKDVLFPYAAERLPDFVRAHRDDPQVTQLLEDARAAAGGSGDDEALIRQLLDWIATDRKITPLKALQGLIWEEGYARGDFRGHIYPDAVRRLRAWHGAGLRLYVYSSGSVHAQKLLFGHTDYGDLTPIFSGFFDTRIGVKREPESYGAIASEIGLPPGEILFLSDIREELDAASDAGMATTALRREGVTWHFGDHPVVENFDGVRRIED
ncbi:acireductone synthase [Thiocapsa bogorovii]|uniref:acireductone synthase n=1 Tax=Thiocapsa bogorovii TaxID=521689 RepID=UPI001E51DCB5|nr:acireductone synthase [Thiocapsa bogorovii]UHD17211.1 acireductone synthase [Thiocapsa bogorovii]